MQWGKTGSNGLQTITLPRAFKTMYIGFSTTERNVAAEKDEGGNAFYPLTLSTCSVSPCSYIRKAFWLAIGY